jgi:RNA polymerase sigma-70 factor (ECF subfamily)
MESRTLDTTVQQFYTPKVSAVATTANARWLELAAAAQAGDGASLDQLLRLLYAAVRKHVYFVIGGGALADDVVQETMIAVHRGLASFHGDASPRTWALTIATRTARRMRARDAHHVPTDELDLAVFDVDAPAAAEMILLRHALARLTPKKREAFILMSLFDLTADEAGEVLATFANTAASRDRHARAELAQYLAEAKQ